MVMGRSGQERRYDERRGRYSSEGMARWGGGVGFGFVDCQKKSPNVAWITEGTSLNGEGGGGSTEGGKGPEKSLGPRGGVTSITDTCQNRLPRRFHCYKLKGTKGNPSWNLQEAEGGKRRTQACVTTALSRLQQG